MNCPGAFDRPWMMVPMMTKLDARSMPTRRPKPSTQGPMKGRATIPPIWYIEDTIPAQIPSFSTPYFSLNQGFWRRLLMREPS